MSRILITGVDGFLGRYLAERFVALGIEVHGFARVQPEPAMPFVSHMYLGELADAEKLKGVVDQARPDLVAHLAAISFVAHGDIEEMYRTNIVGTRNLLGALDRTGISLDAVLLASSGNIYGNKVSGVIDEHTPARPANDYGVSKVAMEHVAALYSDRIPIIIARPFNYTGIGQSEQFIVPKIVDHIKRRAPVINLGNIKVARDFSDVRDTCEAYVKLLSNSGSVGMTLNISSGVAYSVENLLSMATDISRHQLEVRVNSDFIRSNEVPYLCGSRGALDAIIGDFSRHSMADTLRWMLGV